MKSIGNFATMISITLSLVGLLGSTVMGQVAPPKANLDRDNAVALKQLAMAEDMQIMGQIIDKAIERLYQDQTDNPVKYIDMAMMSSGLNNKDKTNRVDKALAVFLDGYGVVYQLEAPLLYTPSATTNKKPASCPFLKLTKWEKTQLNLTGAVNGKHCSQCHRSSKSFYQAVVVFQSVVNQQRVRYSNRVQLVTAPTRDQLVSELLDILAENGHNFRNLKSQEQIKISMTLRKSRQQTTKVNDRFSSMSDSSTDRYRYVYGAMDMGMLPGRNNPSSAGATPSTPSKKNVKDKNTKSNTDNSQGLFRDSKSKSKSTNATEVNRRLFEQGYVYKNSRRYLINLSTGEPSQLLWADEPSSDVQNQILRGDLLMRQGKLEAAAMAFEAAIKKQFGRDPYGESDFGKKFRTDVPANRKLIEKLTRALIGAGQYEKAQSLLEKLTVAANSALAGKQKAATTESIQLATQLTISVTKSQLDAVATGKIDRATFRKQAVIEFFDPTELRRKRAQSKTEKPNNLEGQVRWVDTQLKSVWVNLGKKTDAIHPGTRFNIVSRDLTNPGQTSDYKATIEITRILAAGLYSARILKQDSKISILVGDVIQTPKPVSGKASN